MSKSIKKGTRLKVFNKYNGRCAYCGVSIVYEKFHVDHIEPLFRGSTNKDLEHFGRTKGRNSIENYNPSCVSCNSSKSTFTLDQWRGELELKTSRIRRDSSTFRILERFGKVKVKDVSIVFYFEKTNQWTS